MRIYNIQADNLLNIQNIPVVNKIYLSALLPDTIGNKYKAPEALRKLCYFPEAAKAAKSVIIAACDMAAAEQYAG